ncbi:Ig-like domain-containing protein [Myxococcota bacterium]
MRRERLAWVGVGLGLGLGLGCKTVTMDPIPVESARVAAVFAPDAENPCNSDLPFPTDLAKDPYTGLMNVPFCEEDTPDLITIKYGLRQQDGYALTTPLTFRFTGPIDPVTLDGAITVLDASSLEEVSGQATFFEDRSHQVQLVLDTPLVPATRYLVVVSDAIRDLKGQPVVADQLFTFVKSREPLIDELNYSRFVPLSDAEANALEELRRAHLEVFATAESKLGLKREQIALAWFFSTTSKTYGELQTWALQALNEGSATAVHETAILAQDHLLLAATGLPADSICSIRTGHITMRGFLADSGHIEALLDGSAITDEISIGYVLTVPKHDTACDNPQPDDPIPEWNMEKMVVFVHGLGRCKNDLLALGNAFAAKDWAVLALDGPRAGSRMLNPLGDQNLDGCPDQPDTPELITLGNTSPNPFVLRDHLREWGLEVLQTTELARNAPEELVGQTANTTMTEVSLVGHSWGGIPALLAAPLGQRVDAVAVSATSGGLGAVFAPLVIESIAAQMPDATADEIVAAAGEGISAFNWALEPSDPLLAVSAYPTQMPVLVQVVSPGDEEVALHASADQFRLQRAFGRHPAEDATFTLEISSGATFCDDPTAAVGSLLLPCVDAEGNPTYRALAVEAWAAMQRQVVELVDRHVICSPDIAVACN